MVAAMALDEGIIVSKVVEGSFIPPWFFSWVPLWWCSEESSSSLTTLIKHNPAAHDNSISWTLQHPCTWQCSCSPYSTNWRSHTWLWYIVFLSSSVAIYGFSRMPSWVPSTLLSQLQPHQTSIFCHQITSQMDWTQFLPWQRSLLWDVLCLRYYYCRNDLGILLTFRLHIVQYGLFWQL